jgi:hypothetical protein
MVSSASLQELCHGQSQQHHSRLVQERRRVGFRWRARGHGGRRSVVRQEGCNETEQLNLTSGEKARLFDELRSSLSLADLARQVRNPETAVEVYAASLVAIDESRPEGQAYLHELAATLELPAALVDSVHAEVRRSRRDEAA